ncbi:two-component system OmpR family response regulator [Pseudochelatococcus lubricantis]|uniref:Two-component system OmpR family response regulator n=1 Tax=Pseudochelatococcus lubricantis TaxID=1538102 RepID=A0ABX0V261_9HYPH|nr:response regulator [Pseudochelatococcus lubricantis]NIJ58305.1 two-component system OmpR family response regulator [Pseudochelatococcus lubricantis]
MSDEPHILVVEDDPDISTLIARYLDKNGFRTSVAANGRAMDRILADARIDLIVLDLMLPGEDGLSICRRLRGGSTVPVLMLTARGDEIDRIVGLEMGADDYLVKPFNPRELMARIRAVLRRTAQDGALAGKDMAIYTFDGWVVDARQHHLTDPNGARVAVTGAEFDLLLALCMRPQRVLTREQLLDLTRGREAGPFDRSVDILISRLRQKLEQDPRDPHFIKTVRNSGYMFAARVERQ